VEERGEREGDINTHIHTEMERERGGWFVGGGREGYTYGEGERRGVRGGGGRGKGRRVEDVCLPTFLGVCVCESV
jgi:hypothetical protein